MCLKCSVLKMVNTLEPDVAMDILAIIHEYSIRGRVLHRAYVHIAKCVDPHVVSAATTIACSDLGVASKDFIQTAEVCKILDETILKGEAPGDADSTMNQAARIVDSRRKLEKAPVCGGNMHLSLIHI